MKTTKKPKPTKPQPPKWAIRTRADMLALAQGYYWDEEEAERPIRFAEKHLKPKYTAGEFELFEWQRRFIRSIYGWRRPDGSRRFSKALLHIGKKNGKTLLTAILAQYELYAGRSASPLIVSASTTADNAGQVYESMAASIRKNSKLKRATKFTASEQKIQCSKRDGEYWAMSSDAPGAEGWNISFAIIDEAHAHKNPKLYNTLEFGTSGRPDGWMVIISTAGDDKTHFYYSLLQKARRIQSGEDLDLIFYAEVYEPKESEDPAYLDNPDTWKAGNPSLDLYDGFTSERFRLAWESAKTDPLTRANFIRYRINLFTRLAEFEWIPLDHWDGSIEQPNWSLLRTCKCYLGFDGSLTTDPTSLSAVWLLPEARYYVCSWAWVAEAGLELREKSNMPSYRQYEAEGSMFITDGALIDKESVRAKILELRGDGHQIEKLVCDGNGAHIFGSELIHEGFDVVFLSQTFANFSEPTKRFPADLKAGLIRHNGSTWLRNCLHSVRLGQDRDERVRPIRAKSLDKIDGAVSLLMAFGFAAAAAGGAGGEEQSTGFAAV
ncbi:MAG: terminase large subunit [Fimbriiglobus sp.]